MTRFATIVTLLVAVLVALSVAAMAQSRETPETAFPKDLPEKFHRLDIPSAPRASAWRSNPAGVDNPEAFKLLQDFELDLFPPTGWTLEFTGTQYWTRAAVSGYTVGTGSAKFDFWSASRTVIQSLVTSTFTPSSASDSLVFDYAHAYYSNTSIDSLIIETSTDGGTTWTSLDRLYSSPTPFVSLSTTSSTSQFVPTSASQWGTKRYVIPVGTNKIRFMAKSGYGNNLYLDNIRVGPLDPNDIAATAFVTPPNGGGIPPNTTFTPSASYQNVGTATQTNVSVRFEIRNNVPAVIYTSTKVIASIAPGATTTVSFDPFTGGVAAGNYTMRSLVLTPDANSANDTLNGSFRSVAPLTGTKTIGGSSPDYATFTDAVSDLVLGGVGAGGVTFLVRPGTYPERFAIGPVPGASASNQIIFRRQGGAVTVMGTGTAATNDAMILLNGCDWVTFDSIDVVDGGTSTANQVEYGYALQSYGGTDGANNNTIKNARILLGGSGAAPGFSHGVLIANAATSPSGGCNNNKIQNLIIDRSDRGVGIFAVLDATGNILFGDDNNEVSGCVLGQTVPLGDSLSSLSGSPIGIIVSANTNAKVFNNTLHSLRSRNAGSTASMLGISCQVSTGDFYNNKIYDIRHFGTTSTALAGGIQSAPPINGTARIFNNFVSNVTRDFTGAATSTIASYGIGTTNLTTNGNGVSRVFYNSVYLKDTVSGGVRYSSGALVLFNSGLPVEARNNVFVNNTSTSSATAKSFAIADANTVRYALTSNNNNLYAGGANGHIGLVGTLSAQTLASWQSQTGQDLNSASENPPFRNTATAPYDLHIDSTVATRLESGGVNIPGITTDIDGQTRVVATRANVAPDIGADEFGGTEVDNVGPTITYTPLSGTGSTGNRTLDATIRDLVSGVHVQPGLQPRLYYKKNGGSNWSSPTVDSAGVRVGNVWTFTINTTLLGGLVLGDTVYYYVAAADSAGNVSTNPAGGSGLTPPGNVAPPNTNFYRVYSTISGSMTIGPSAATFTSIKAAFDSINASVLTGNVTLLINSDYVSSVEPSFPLTLNQPIYSGSTPFTITLKPNTGATPTISGVSTSSIIKLNGADYVIIDGSNTSGGTTRNLTITNTGTGANTAAVWLSSLGPGAGCTNNVIKNCNISAGVAQNTATTITFGIVSSGATIATTGDGFDNNNNTFTNNYVTKARYGIFLRGAQASLNTGNVINQNLVGPVAFGADQIGAGGIIIQHQLGATVTQNEVRSVGGTLANTSAGDDRFGIGVGTLSWPVSSTNVTNVTNSAITRNLVHDIVDERTYSAAGIAVGSNANPSGNTIANNMIYRVWANGTAPDQCLGIGIGAGNGDVVVYNSVFMKKDTIDPAGTSLATQSGAGIRIASATLISNLTLKNNIVYVDLGSQTSTLKHYAIVAPTTTFGWGTLAGSNYNDYVVNSANPQMVFGGIGTAVPYTNVASLAAWQATFSPSQDLNSISAWPGFKDTSSTVDLHINALAPSPVNNAGTPIAGVTVDYDGQTRSTTTPDIGADEFTPVVPVISNIVRSTRVPLAGDTLVVTCTITDTVGIATANLIYNVNDTVNSVAMVRTSGTPQNGTYRGVVPGSANQNGNRVELQIEAISSGGLSTVTPKAAALSYYAGISPLSLTGLRRMHPNGRIIDSLYYARVTGTINGPNFQTTNLGYHFQDAVGGIQLFSFGITRPPLNLGDSIIVVGRIMQFRGLTEIVPDTQATDIQVVATGRPVTPTTVSVAAFNANPEQYESRLLRMTSLQRRDPTPPWPGAGTSANIVMYQNVVTDTIIMRIDSDTEIPGSPEPSYPVNVTGVISQFSSAPSVYNNGYQTQPRYLTDLQNPGLSGTYTVGSGGQYPTLDSAFADIARGITGPVTLSLIDSLYAPVTRLGETDAQALSTPRTLDMESEDGHVVTIDPQAETSKEEPTDSPEIVGITLVGPIPGASATNRVTIRPANNVRARIVGTGAATFNFRNVSYVTFDGVSTTGPTQLSIENTASNGIAIALLGNSDNNIIQNLTIRSLYASGIGIYADTASGAAPDSNLISGNKIPVSQLGVYLRGGIFIARGNRILNNQLGSDSLGLTGIYNQQVAGSVIANNRIENVKDAALAGGNIAGIWIATRQLNLRVYNNVINGVRTRPSATGPVFASGIYYFGTSNDTTRSLFYNNMVYGVENFTSNASGTLRALYASTSRLDTVAYNTVYVTGAAAGPIISGALYLGTPQQLTIRNNIAMNTQLASDTGRALAFYVLSTAATFTSNYNDLYVPAQQTGSHIAAITTTNYTTLRDWVASGRDSQSVSVVVHFRSPDLHVDSTIVTPINGGATPIAGITTDIDGQTRDATAPDIGADEFAPGAPPAPGWTIQTSGVTNYLFSVKAVNQSVAWAAGAGGTVIRTVNGGGTWTSVGGGAIGTNDIYNIDALDANTAFVTTSPSGTFIFRTTNGGATWQQVYTDASNGAFIDAISMLNPSVGIAQGDPTGGRWTILYTSNGGTTWVRDTVNAPLQQGTESGTQNGLARIGNTHAWFTASQGGRIYRTTNGGASWSSSSVPTATGTNNVWFNDTQYGVATSIGSNLVFRSTDGGATWTSITPAGSGFLLACAGSGTSDFWYARGTSIYRSTNRGATFTSSHTGTGTYVALSFSTLGTNTAGWGVTSTGGVARFFGTITDVEEQPMQELPETFSLFQNYPNPFNPTTTIRYALPRDARVTVSVYNILGQLVNELVNDVQSAGYYTVNWNGRNQSGLQAATGVYLYRIEARPTDGSAPFVSTKKMVLMK